MIFLTIALEIFCQRFFKNKDKWLAHWLYSVNFLFSYEFRLCSKTNFIGSFFYRTELFHPTSLGSQKPHVNTGKFFSRSAGYPIPPCSLASMYKTGPQCCIVHLYKTFRSKDLSFKSIVSYTKTSSLGFSIHLIGLIQFPVDQRHPIYCTVGTKAKNGSFTISVERGKWSPFSAHAESNCPRNYWILMVDMTLHYFATSNHWDQFKL